MWNAMTKRWPPMILVALLLAPAATRIAAQTLVPEMNAPMNPGQPNAAPQPNQPTAAQPQPPEDIGDDPNLPREERLRRHMLRLQKIVSEAQAREAAQKPPSPVPTPPPPPVPVPTPPTPAAPQAAPAPPPTAQVPFRTSRAIVFIHPFQALSRIGDTLETEVRVYNSSGGPYDQIDLHLRYDPLVVAPERVNDAPIYKLLAGPPRLRVNQSKGDLEYTAQLTQGILKTTATLLAIQWRALNPIFHSEIGFVSDDEGTRIGRDGGNILGFVAAGKRIGGAMPGIIVVSPRDNSPRQIIPPFGEIVVASLSEFVSLHLQADSDAVAKGEEWIVSLTLRNDAAIPFNDVRVRVLFDPAKLQVVDWHQGNWIRQGINIYDGFAHETYPFDVFEANAADNARGEILYRVGSRAARMFPGGTFARIKFKALADASLNDVWFDFEDPKRSVGAVETDVTFLGSSVMFEPQRKVEAEERPAPAPLRRPD